MQVEIGKGMDEIVEYQWNGMKNEEKMGKKEIEREEGKQAGKMGCEEKTLHKKDISVRCSLIIIFSCSL